MIFDQDTLKNLLGFRDDVGVLSVYVGFTPDQAADPQPVAPIEIRNQVRDLKRGLRDDHPHEAWQAVEQRLEELDNSDFDGLLDPKAQGQGRVLFVGVASGQRERLHLQVPFRDRVIFDDTPFLRPLVAALDEGRAAGVLLVNSQNVRLLQWSAGETEELDDWSFELKDAQLADVKSGPSANNPRQAGKGLVNRERFEDRIDDNRSRFLKDVVEDVERQAQQRGWDRVVVAGAAKIREEVAGQLDAANGLRVLRAEHDWEGSTTAQIAERAWPLLRSVHRRREVELVEQARDRALSGGTGALGLRGVLEALNTGQVAHLLFDSGLEAHGFTTSEGTLHATEDGDAAAAGFELTPEPLLVERMVEKVVGYGGTVTPCEEGAAELLTEHDGVAALLRW